MIACDIDLVRLWRRAGGRLCPSGFGRPHSRGGNWFRRPGNRRRRRGWVRPRCHNSRLSGCCSLLRCHGPRPNGRGCCGLRRGLRGRRSRRPCRWPRRPFRRVRRRRLRRHSPGRQRRFRNWLQRRCSLRPARHQQGQQHDRSDRREPRHKNPDYPVQITSTGNLHQLQHLEFGPSPLSCPM